MTAGYDRLPGPFLFRVLSRSRSGEISETYVEAEGNNAALVGLHNGFAAAFVGWTGRRERELVVIRLYDGATSGVMVNEPDGLIQAVGLRP